MVLKGATFPSSVNPYVVIRRLEKLLVNISLFSVSTNIHFGFKRPVFPPMILNGGVSPSSVLLYTVIVLFRLETNNSSLSTSIYTPDGILSSRRKPALFESNIDRVLKGWMFPVSVLPYTVTVLFNRLAANISLFTVSTNIASIPFSSVFVPPIFLKGLAFPSSVSLYTLILFSKTGSILEGGGTIGENSAKRPTNISSLTVST